MKTIRPTIRLVGVLYLLQLTTAIISYSVLLEPILFSKDFLVNVQSHETSVIIGMFLDLICGIAIVAIATLLYPMLKKHSERAALWYLGLRIVEFVTIIISSIALLSLLSLSKEYVLTSGEHAEDLQHIGKYILKARSWTQNMTILSFGLGASVFYSALLKYRLIPLFIPIWGLIGVALALVEIVCSTFGYHLSMLVYMPMGLNEIFLGIWFLIKGVRSVEITG